MIMKTLQMSHAWLRRLLPDGFMYPSSTLISGPGGSGKPLIGFAFAHDWLQAGGNVIFVALQYPETKFVKTSLKKIYNLNIDDYTHAIGYVQFDHDIETWQRSDQNTIRANLLKPPVWEDALQETEDTFAEPEDPGTLVFASALNLLLFSPTYRDRNVDAFETILKQESSRTYLLSVSTSAYREEIRRWENAADTLLITRMDEDMRLYLSVERLNNTEVSSAAVAVPIEKEILQGIKEVAEGVRKRQIPGLRKI